MSNSNPNPDAVQNELSEQSPESTTRLVGGTEYSWCRAVPGGTGITVLALLLSKPPDIQLLQTSLHNLQNAHPILRSKLRFNSNTNAFSIITPPSPHIQIQLFDLQTTSKILSVNDGQSIDPYHLILERELNRNSWSSILTQPSDSDTDVFFVSLYTLSETQWAVVLRLHTAACDRASVAALLRELLGLMGGGGGEGERTHEEYNNNVEVGLGIEDLIPEGKANKPFWMRGIDLLGYSLNSFRLANLHFVDADSPRRSQVVRLRMNPDDTHQLLAGCKRREIKLCGALVAAALIAAYSSKDLPHYQGEKYAVVTLVDCRSTLDPTLNSRHVGFYRSAIMSTHDISGGERLWEVAKRCYSAFANAKNNNKHFTDIGDLNFLMCKAIDNPSLTTSSALRTAFISVFEDSVIDDFTVMYGEPGVEDYVGCGSVHGVSPSVAIFNTVRHGGLDCACVYPSPLHSREQIQKLIDEMKRILEDGIASDHVENER